MARRRGTRAERREEIERLLAADPGLSNRAIARATTSDHKTVGRLRRESAGAQECSTPRGNAPNRTPRLVPQAHGGVLSMPGAGNARAVKHGAWGTVGLQPRVDELTTELRDVVPGRQLADETAIRLLALALARIETVTAWLDARGLFKDQRGNLWPVAKNLSAWENSAGRLCDQLGLTPTARARLGVVKPGLDGYAQFLDAIKAEAQPATEEAVGAD